MTLSKAQIISGNQAILAAGLEGSLIASTGIPLIWIFESANTPSTGVQLTRKLSDSEDYTLCCRSLYLSEEATVTIDANGGVWDIFTGRYYDFGSNGLWLNPLDSLKVVHTNTSPIGLITLVATPALIAARKTWI